MAINLVVIAGNLTREPDFKATQSGTAVLRFGMAVNDRVKNQQTGEWEDRPNFVDCSIFGNRAQALSSILHKGMKVTVQGKLRYSSWEKDGQKHSKLEVVADDVELPPKASQGQQAYAPQQPYVATTPAYVPATPPAPAYQPPQAAYVAPTPAYQAPQTYQPQQAAPVYAAPPAYQPQPQMPAAQAPSVDVYDEDIPF